MSMSPYGITRPQWVKKLKLPGFLSFVSETKMAIGRIIFWGSLLLFLAPVTTTKKNLLFLVADDMRPQLTCYEGQDFPTTVHPKMHTPNLDRLASRSLLLKRAYVQQTLCAPSRTSLLTGRRPDTTHTYGFAHYFRTYSGNFTTIPQYFKERGYRSVGAGKVFHPGVPSGGDDPISWTDPYYHAPNFNHWEMGSNHSWYAVSEAERTATPLPDDQITQYTIDMMKKLAPAAKSGAQPFFLAAGFRKPHLPFVFPEEYFKYYPLEEIRLPKNPRAPSGMPRVAWWNYFDLRAYGDIKALNESGAINTTLPDKVVRHLRRAYYSAITYVDDQLGKIMQALEDLELADNTIVSFWGDHGWQLGEHGEWEKETNFELTTHAPMMVRVPGLTDNGVATRALVEFVDLFPTLVEAAGFPPLEVCPEDHSQQTDLCREGSSFMPLMKNASLPWKKAVFSQFPRPMFTDFTSMGYSVRVDNARYTEWVGFNFTTFTPIWDQVNGTELYDHSKDPDENWNRADDPSYANMRELLRRTLHSGWRQTLPDMEKDTTLKFIQKEFHMPSVNTIDETFQDVARMDV